jgi:hypothetical protein
VPLWDAQSTDLLIIRAGSNGSLNFYRPDGANKRYILHATLTKGRGSKVVFQDRHLTEGFKEKGELKEEGYLYVQYKSFILSFEKSERLELADGDGIRWVSRLVSDGKENVRTFSYIPVRDNTALETYRDAHIAKNIANGMDSEGMKRSMAEYQRIAAEQERQREAQKAQERAEGGGMLGTVMAATAGALAAKSVGGDAEQVLGGALMGARVANPGNAAIASLGAQGEAMVTGNTGALSSGLAGTRGASGGSYPTRPNLALGACAGFTEANYRQRALSGGGDQQLYTMCGQAFEYYVMYKRAIAQGYSEADANRTYAAHQQAANVASGFLQSHGAN